MATITVTVNGNKRQKQVSLIGVAAACRLEEKKLARRFPDADRKWPGNRSEYWVGGVCVASVEYTV